jgi:aspartate racemase
MKTLGILGGMGPGATVDFMAKIVRLAGDDWPRIIMEMDPSIPSRTLAAMGKGADPGPQIIAATDVLEERGADVIAVPCNSAHAWYPTQGETRWLNMPVVVSDAMKKRGIVHPLIVGGYATIAKRLYDPYFEGGAVYLDDHGNQGIYETIARIKQQNCLSIDEGYSGLVEGKVWISLDQCDAVLLACTELSIIWPVDSEGECRNLLGKPVIDSSWEYAKAIMRKLRGE